MTDKPVNGRLLLVDDERNVGLALRRHFEPLGYLTRMASNGQEALAALAVSKIDVLITDMHMPVMNGAELLQEVTEKYPEVARVLLTGYADLQLTTRALRDGLTDHYLTKPWEPEQLEQCIESALRARIR